MQHDSHALRALRAFIVYFLIAKQLPDSGTERIIKQV